MSSMFSTLLRSNVRVVARVSCRSLSTTAFRSALLHARPNVHVASRQLVGPVQLATRRWFSGEGGPPKRILFAGNLPFNMSEDDIRYEFSNFGTMDKVIIGADASGRPMGWAMLVLAEPDHAESILSTHEQEPFTFSGRIANITWARNQNVIDRKAKAVSEPSNTLYVGSIAFNAEEEDVFEAFSRYGHVKRVSMGRRPDGEFRGFAHVEFSEIEHATAAIEEAKQTPFSILERPVFLDFSAPKQRSR